MDSDSSSELGCTADHGSDPPTDPYAPDPGRGFGFAHPVCPEDIQARHRAALRRRMRTLDVPLNGCAEPDLPLLLLDAVQLPSQATATPSSPTSESTNESTTDA